MGFLQDEIGGIIARRSTAGQVHGEQAHEITLERVSGPRDTRSVHLHMESTQKTTEIAVPLSQQTQNLSDWHPRPQ